MGEGLSHLAPFPQTFTWLCWVTFVGPLGNPDSLADELIVSPPSAPTHTITWAAKATTMIWEGRRILPVPKDVPSLHKANLQHWPEHAPA